MNTSDVFEICNTIVVPAWLILMVFPVKSWRNPLIYTFAAAMALIYGYYVVTGLGGMDPAAFTSLEGVKGLFSKDEALMAGWVHYLIFDLLVGNWVVNQSIRYNIGHFWVIPCLFFCFMFGPLGFLFFYIVKVLKARTVA